MLIFFNNIGRDMSLPGQIKTQIQLFGESPDNNVRYIAPQAVRDIAASFQGYIGTIDPETIDDSANTHGTGFFDYNYLWLNKTDGSIWCCIDPTPFAAQWRKIYPQSFSGLPVSTYTPPVIFPGVNSTGELPYTTYTNSSGITQIGTPSPYIGTVSFVNPRNYSGNFTGTDVASGLAVVNNEIVHFLDVDDGLHPDRGGLIGPWIIKSGTWERPIWFQSGQPFASPVHIYSVLDQNFYDLVGGIDGENDPFRVGADGFFTRPFPFTQVLAGTNVSVDLVGDRQYQVSAFASGGIQSGQVQSGAISIIGQSGITVSQPSDNSWVIGQNIQINSGQINSGAINNSNFYPPAWSGQIYPVPGGGGGGATKVFVSGRCISGGFTIINITNTNGLHGCLSVKNTDLSGNNMFVQFVATDMYGTVASSSVEIFAGTAAEADFDDALADTGLSGAAYPPHVNVQVDVFPDGGSPGNATYNAYMSYL